MGSTGVEASSNEQKYIEIKNRKKKVRQLARAFKPLAAWCLRDGVFADIPQASFSPQSSLFSFLLKIQKKGPIN